MGPRFTSLGAASAAFAMVAAGTAWAGDGCQTLASENFETIPPGTVVNQIVSGDFQWSGPDGAFVAEIAQGCAADLNGNGVVNGADLAALLTQWGSNGSADINGDGVVNGADLASLLTSWGVCTVNRVLQFDFDQFQFPNTVFAQTNQSLLPTFPNTLRLQYDSFVGSNDVILRVQPIFSQPVALAVVSSFAPDIHYTLIGADISSTIGHFFQTGKQNIFGESATIVLEFTNLTEFAPPSVRVLVRDSETVALFGDAPVEIFPAGPFGSATAEDGVPAADPFFIPATLIEGFSFNPGLVTPGTAVYVDNLRISNCPPSP